MFVNSSRFYRSLFCLLPTWICFTCLMYFQQLSKKQTKSVKTPTNSGTLSNTYNINTLEQVYPLFNWLYFYQNKWLHETQIWFKYGFVWHWFQLFLKMVWLNVYLLSLFLKIVFFSFRSTSIFDKNILIGLLKWFHCYLLLNMCTTFLTPAGGRY